MRKIEELKMRLVAFWWKGQGQFVERGAWELRIERTRRGDSGQDGEVGTARQVERSGERRSNCRMPNERKP